MIRAAIGNLAALALVACGTVSRQPEPPVQRAGDVGVELVLPPPGASHMELPSTQRFVFPDLIESFAMPIYPPTLLTARLEPVELCIESDIGPEGAVIAARQRLDSGCAGAPVREEFVRASLEAVRNWRFAPALLCIAPDADSDDPCTHPQVTKRPTAVRLSYAFRFSQRDGKPLVERIGSE